MQTHLTALFLFSALSGGTRETTIYDDYKEAWRAGRSQSIPVLVILNPGADTETPGVNLELLRQAAHRRTLLANYVVAVIDTSTPEGKVVHKLFQSPPLPRVAVLDKQQKWQVYRTSRALSAQDWNLVLEKYQKGEAPAVRSTAAVCRT